MKNTNKAKKLFPCRNREKWTESRKKKRVFDTTLSYKEHFLILVSTVTGCICISGFVSLVGIPIEIMSFVIGLESCAITVEITKYKSAILKKKKKHNKIVLFAKSKLNSLVVLISNVLIDWNISNMNLF